MPYSFIGADVPANLVAHYFVEEYSHRYGEFETQPYRCLNSHTCKFILWTAELNINMSIEPFDSSNGPPVIRVTTTTMNQEEDEENSSRTQDKHIKKNYKCYSRV